MAYYEYTPYIEQGPNGVNLRFTAGESGATELATIGEKVYVYVPSGATLPEQPQEINFTEIVVSDELLAQIKAASRQAQLISEEMITKIRNKYTIDDEMYFARIGVGAANGLYQPAATELAELAEFGQFVESVRAWGRTERAKIGLN
jgi:hypothetical protein